MTYEHLKLWRLSVNCKTFKPISLWYSLHTILHVDNASWSKTLKYNSESHRISVRHKFSSILPVNLVPTIDG